METSAFIALGSNLNLDGVSSLELIKKAIIELEKSNFNLQAISRFLKTQLFQLVQVRFCKCCCKSPY